MSFVYSYLHFTTFLPVCTLCGVALKRESRFAGRYAWQNRRELVVSLIRESGAALIGVQELTPSMRADLQSRLPDYRIFGLGRTRRMENEHAAILLHTPEATLQRSQTFWLSKHPEKSGSRAYFAMFPRVCTVCEVFVAAWQCKIRVFNTHFDHICGPARTLGVRVILQYMHRLNQQERLPSILMGDFNAKPASKPIRLLSENRHGYEDIHLTNLYTGPETLGNTYHGFSGRVSGEPIDYIFVSEELEAQGIHVNTTCVNGCYPSDHYPLVAMLRRKPSFTELV